MSDEHHDRVADFLDKPLPEGGTHRKRVATMARAYLMCHDIAPLVAESGLDIDDIVAHLTRWRAVLLLIVMCSCGGPVLPPKPQSCGYLGDLCSKLAPCCPSVNGAAIECLDGTCERK